MNLNTILFPIDFSHASHSVLELATSLARNSKGTLLIVHVEEPPMAYGGGELYYGALETTRNEWRTMLGDVRPSDPDVPCEHLLITGEPAGALVKLAKERNVELIIMGTHGRTGISRLLMGSIAEAVVRRAPCPVLTYREPSHTPAMA